MDGRLEVDTASLTAQMAYVVFMIQLAADGLGVMAEQAIEYRIYKFKRRPPECQY